GPCPVRMQGNVALGAWLGVEGHGLATRHGCPDDGRFAGAAGRGWRHGQTPRAALSFSRQSAKAIVAWRNSPNRDGVSAAWRYASAGSRRSVAMAMPIKRNTLGDSGSGMLTPHLPRRHLLALENGL